MKSVLFYILLLVSPLLLRGQQHNLINAGVSAMQEGNEEEAIRILTAAIKQDSKSELAYYNRAVVYFNSGDYQKAFEDCNMCVKLDPSKAEYYQIRIAAAEAINDFAQVVADYNVLIALNPHNQNYLQSLGTFYMQQKRYGEAILIFSKLISYKSSHKYALFQRAYANSQLNQNENALEDYNRVLELDPDDRLALNNRANCHMDLEHWTEAKHDYELLLQRYPDHENASVNINYINWKLKIDIPSEKQKTKYWVVAVGISKYQNPSVMSSLASPARYAFEFSRVIRKNPYIGSTEMPVLTDDIATKSSILKKMKTTFWDTTKVGQKDVIIFYFSGHGKMLSDRIGICPYDYFNQQQLISESEIVEIMELSPAKYKIFINESCRSNSSFIGPTLFSSNSGSSATQATTDSEVIIISSTQRGQESFEIPDLGAVFSHYLVKAFDGEADLNSNKIISVSELFQFLHENVFVRTSGAQTPQIISKYKNHEVPVMQLKE